MNIGEHVPDREQIECRRVGPLVVGERRDRERELGVLALALVLAMSTWFSTAAVLPQLRDAWRLSSGSASALTIAVQLGFVVGAVVSATTNLADRIPALRLVLLGTIGAALSNASLVIVDDTLVAILARALTGAFLAAVYPPALKAMTAWFRTDRGLALGVMIGALTIGSALPHLINAAVDVGWEVVIIATSVLTIVGGLLADRLCSPGPDAPPAASFDPSQVAAIVRSRSFLLAAGGYLGHMWELYAMWAWIAAFYGDVFTSQRQASAAAFAVIAVGAAGAVYAGLVSDRVTRSEAAARAMRWSASVAVVMGFLLDAPVSIVVGVGLVWGFWVVADSAQFSAIVTEVVDRRYVGTALTLQLASGFVLSVATIWIVPIVRDAHGWGWAFFVLAPGPILGAWAMRALRVGPRPKNEPPAPAFASPFF